MSSTKKPAVSLVKGRHITAADKRNIVEGIDWLRKDFAASIAALPEQTPDYGAIWIRRNGSPKQYSIAPTEDLGRYSVVIRETYRTDYGQTRQSNSAIMVRIANLEPLYMPAGADQ